MPYNTRRKSLSLPLLGVHVPVSHAERAANAAAAAAANNSNSLNSPAASAPSIHSPSPSPPPGTKLSLLPPPKKIKRSHGSASPAPMSPPNKRDPPPKSILKYEHTPPPSPEAEQFDHGRIARTIDFEAINDDIVEGVIVQLQQTANRPHLVKELAAVLSHSVKIVETSANPSAIISSRLAAYLKRPCWSALTPCPLAKELETVHPRRTYFYLTTCPHQAIPDPVASAAASNPYQHRSIISPSLSGASSKDDDDRRRELSPSPEVDLSPDFGDDYDEDDTIVTPPTPTGSFSGRNSLIVTNRPSGVLTQNHRAASPPLQEDEIEFTTTAQGMQTRKLAVEISAEYMLQEETHLAQEDSVSMNLDAAESLFGTPGRNANASSEQYGHVLFSSPVVKFALMASTPVIGIKRGFEEIGWDKAELGMDWDTRSPEVIELDELDGLLDDF